MQRSFPGAENLPKGPNPRCQGSGNRLGKSSSGSPSAKTNLAMFPPTL